MSDSISKGEIIHAVNAEVNKPKKVRYKLHTPIEEVVIEFDEKEEVTSIDHILSDSIPIFEESAQAFKALTGEDMGKTEPSDLMSHEEAWNTIESDLISRADAVKAIQKYICNNNMGDDGDIGMDAGLELAIDEIKALPSADVISRDVYNKLAQADEKIIDSYRQEFQKAISAKTAQGEWKHTITWQPYCSNCEYVFGEDEEFSPFWKYCPMCGARMKGGDIE